jgi:hypothetical protein
LKFGFTELSDPNYPRLAQFDDQGVTARLRD